MWMEVIRLTKENAEEVAARVAEVLRAGGVILYPTDTLYGLGADAFSDTAVDKIYAIKGREEGKPIHAIVSDLGMAAKYGNVDDRVGVLAEKLPKGKITFVTEKRDGVRGGIARAIDTFGFRIPDNDFCIALTRAFGGPITATSANRSGEKSKSVPKEILSQLGEAVKYIDLIIDAGELPACEPSSVVGLSGTEPKVIREGAIASTDIYGVLLGFKRK